MKSENEFVSLMFSKQYSVFDLRYNPGFMYTFDDVIDKKLFYLFLKILRIQVDA